MNQIIRFEEVREPLCFGTGSRAHTTSWSPPLLLDELERALGYSKLRDRVTIDEARELLELLSRAGLAIGDPPSAPDIHPPDPDDDYLIALASIARAVIVSGDKDLLGLSGQIPVYSPARFVALIEVSS